MTDYKSKWCPMLRISINPDGHLLNNRLDESTSNTNCIGPDCAMWREKPAPQTNVLGDPLRNLAPRRTISYCGLAGKPEVV